mgnify:CR=1 FL=1
MRIHEYQAKRLLSEFGVPMPKGRLASTPEQAREAAERIGGARGAGPGIPLGRGCAGSRHRGRSVLGDAALEHDDLPDDAPARQAVESRVDVLER